MSLWTVLTLITSAWATTSVAASSSDSSSSSAPFVPVSCGCISITGESTCGTNPAFMQKSETDIARELGFDVPGDHTRLTKSSQGTALYLVFANFLEKSDRVQSLIPNFYTKAAQEAAQLTLASKSISKNATETDEYFRCTIPQKKYCLYKTTLRPYMGLVAKTSGIDFSFLACQSYVESRFSRKAKSGTGAVGYSQIQPANIDYLNEILQRSIRNSSNRKIASVGDVNELSARETRIAKVQEDIATLWKAYWKGTQKIPTQLAVCDLSCYRQAFLVQALSLKTDMLAFATSSSGIKADFDETGALRIEGMDKGDSLLLLAGSYNVGVTKMIRLIGQYCSGSTSLKDCLDKIDVGSAEAVPVTNYITRIRNCNQKFSAEQIDFNDDEKWTDALREEKQNQQREKVVTCLLHPCPL
jgi:hypothetical protein